MLAMAAEVRSQFMAAVRDKKQLEAELAVARASAGGGAADALPPVSVDSVLSPGAQGKLAALTTPQRATFQNMRLQMWREEQVVCVCVCWCIYIYSYTYTHARTGV
jgi:hypothetical protein